MKDNKNNPFPDKRFNMDKLNRYRDSINDLAASLAANYPIAMRSGISLDQIKTFASEEDFVAFVADSKRKYLASFPYLPTEERTRISSNFNDVITDYKRSVMAVASVFKSPYIVIDQGEDGTPSVNVNKSMSAVKGLCYDKIDNEKMLRLRDGLSDLIGAISKFNSLVIDEADGRDLLHGGALISQRGASMTYRDILDQILTNIDGIDVDGIADFVFVNLVARGT